MMYDFAWQTRLTQADDSAMEEADLTDANGNRVMLTMQFNCRFTETVTSAPAPSAPSSEPAPPGTPGTPGTPGAPGSSSHRTRTG